MPNSHACAEPRSGLKRRRAHHASANVSASSSCAVSGSDRRRSHAASGGA